MNSLNSVLLEGLVCDFVGDKFSLKTIRYYKENNEPIQKVCNFDIKTYGRLAEYCKRQLTEGAKIRIIGRLDYLENKIIVVAEHIEIVDIKGEKK